MGFLNKAFRKVKKQIQPGQMPRRGGGFGNLGRSHSQIKRTTQAAIWVCQECQVLTMGSPGGTPGFYDNMRENMSPGQRLEQRPNFGMEQMICQKRKSSQKRSFSARAYTDGQHA
jgi:hypothetical protein